MGRSRKRFNEKARQTQDAEVCRDDKEKVVVDMKIHEEKYDSNNPLVICGKKKKKVKSAQKEVSVPKPLSRKQKKKLANILAKKKKKINRAELLEKLEKVQAKPQDLDFLVSTAAVQTHGLKKLSLESNISSANKRKKISNIKGSRKQHLLSPNKKMKLDPNIVGFYESSSSESDDGSEDENRQDMNSTQKEEIDIVHNNSESNTDSADVIIPVLNENSEEKDAGNAVSTAGEGSKKIGNLQEELKENSTETKGTDKPISAHPVEHVPAVYVSLNRLPEVQAAREALPIFCEEQAIMEAVRENPVVVIHGETGSGKTTQVPQFLYEGGYTQGNRMIGITEPRRIAAMSMAARVGTEMNLPDVVAYHVRYENNVKEETQIKFMTDGVLLKEIRHDFYLTRYSVLIIDEAHERSVFSDVLIGLLSRIVVFRAKNNNPLKLIIMSATIRVEDFVENPKLFKEPPFLIRLESRQYKVQVHFNKQTPSDYLEAAYHKVCKIHSQLPPGAILVFVTGEKEVIRLCKMLRNTFPFKDNQEYKSENLKTENACSENTTKKKKNKRTEIKDTSFCSLPAKIDLDNYSVEPLDTEALEHELSEEEDNTTEFFPTEKHSDMMPLYTLPLYSILPFEEQEKVFQPPPPGTRLCVVSTNVAETSITIPGLKYVVDSGKVKTKEYDKLAGGISKFCIAWTSKASANQRAGRAGRTEGGHCYRLYSSAVFDHEFLDFSPPEIQRIPVDDVLLQMKALGIPRVVNFPFPSPPDPESLKAAERRLVLLGALEDLSKGERYKDIKKWEYSAKITPLGKAMSRFPLTPRFAKMLILSYKHSLVPYIIALVSAMTVPQVFVNNSHADDNEQSPEENVPQEGIRKMNIKSAKSLQLGDAMVLLRAVALYEERKNKVQFCIKNGIRHKAMVEIHKMCIQLLREMNKAFQDLALPLEMNLSPPDEEQLEKIRKILATGFTDHVARLLPKEDMNLNKELKNAYKCLDLEDPVFIHPSSVLFTKLPQYVIYQEIVHTSKYYMKGVIEIEPEWLSAYAPTLCKFSDPLEEPAPKYDQENDRIYCTRNVQFGSWLWDLPAATMEMPKSVQKYIWFAFFLLDGQVHSFFKNYRPHLLFSPSVVHRTWARLRPHVRYLLQALFDKEVDSRESLVQIWGKEPKYLLREYWEWLPSEKHMEIECQWPPK